MRQPTARTLERLKQLGFDAGVVERFNPFSKRKHDLFGFCDIVAIREGVGTILIQTTSGNGGNRSSRRKKIFSEPRAAIAARCGNRIEVWSWAKRGPRGKRKLWTLNREDLTAQLREPSSLSAVKPEANVEQES